MQNKRIILLAGQWDTTSIVYNYLKRTIGVEMAIMEDPIDRTKFLKTRAKKLGWLTVIGQILFQLLIAMPMSFFSRRRVAEILKQYNLEREEIHPEAIINVASVNTEECLNKLISLKPDLVIVHGTRIISKRILQNVPCPFVNIHAGITPRYRGAHGAYWALANSDEENCGVTVHLVDAGIDTGAILSRKKIPITKRDNFATYPYLQLAEGLKCLSSSISLLLEERQTTEGNQLESRLWYHPTLWSYLYSWFKKGVK